MKKILSLLIFTAFICSAMSPPVHNSMVEIAIADYLKCRQSKPFDTFILWIDEISEYAPYKINDEMTVIDISPAFHKVYLTSVDTMGSIRVPTRHLIKDGKLFYWHDPDMALPKK